jgi:hypothetical protein
MMHTTVILGPRIDRRLAEKSGADEENGQEKQP